MPCFPPINKQNIYRSNEEARRLTTRRICAHLIPSRAHDFFAPPKVPGNIRQEHHKYVKSLTPTLSYQEQTRLKNAAKMMTVQERLDALVKKEELSRKQHEEADGARDYFRAIDDKRLRDLEASTVKQGKEDEALIAKEKQKTLEHAFIQKHEQEEEVKAVNRLIFHAKCQAVRDAQMEEKRGVKNKQMEDRIRLERMVIDENAKALAREEILAMKHKEQCEKYAREIREQLLERENMRFIEAERTEEEAKAQRIANAMLQQEEELKMRQAKERRDQFRNELDRIVEMSNLFRKMLCEQEHETEERVAAYLRKKQEWEKQLEREKELAREEFERKQQLLFELAEKRLVSKSQREEMELLREQEHAEREYRRREREAALRRKCIEDDIRDSRQRQAEEMKTRQALQIAREEKDFLAMIESLKKEEERLKQQEASRGNNRECYRAEIQRQISDKAIGNRRLKDFERNEAVVWREGERKRLENIRIVINAKLVAMREACLPEHYIKDIERQMNRIMKRIP